MPVDVGHVLGGRQLAVGHVEEVATGRASLQSRSQVSRWVWSSAMLPLLAWK